MGTALTQGWGASEGGLSAVDEGVEAKRRRRKPWVEVVAVPAALLLLLLLLLLLFFFLLLLLLLLGCVSSTPLSSLSSLSPMK